MKSVNFNVPKLETDRLMLRKLNLGDIEDMHTYTSSIEVTKYVPFPNHKSLADTEAFIHYVMEQYENNKTVPWEIELKESGKLIGTIEYVSWEPAHHIEGRILKRVAEKQKRAFMLFC
ncbi:hypothetical protein GCM10009865_08320 [Aeromicrobium ponti]|uniref:Ribosomal-protein-alanine N-acetyltransferase n=1 Tax=Cytobacillus oceanisediminis TaxID=665099 RepID=A0A562K786_9BACI|nr:GNAT family N-acetyltransferase [Cytobacillus oceanisediminis]TWH91272.1 ribosomal-protein-alanine N-acetyltransferase [Cytobacillus oceanisediminis]